MKYPLRVRGWLDKDSRRPAAIAGAVVLVHLALAALWIAWQETPTGGRDEFFIVEVATELAFKIRSGAGFEELRSGLLDSYYPPLVRAPGIAALIAGGGYDAMIVAQWLLWLPMLLVGTWVVGRRIGGRFGAASAVAVLVSAPAIVDCLHRYESNLGATASAVCLLAVWLHADDLRDRRMALLFGLLAGVGLMSDRLGAVPFAVPLVVLSLVRTRGRGGIARGLGLAGLAALLVCGWWYADFVQRFWSELLPQFLSGEIEAQGALVEEQPPLLLYWLHYLVLWPDSQFGLVGGLVGFVALGWAGLRAGAHKDVRDVLIFVAFGLVLFTITPKRQVYYTMPLLPAAAALVGGMLAELRRRHATGGLVTTVALVSAMSLPTALTVRPEIVDLNPGLAEWLIAGISPIPEPWIGHRYPIGWPPVDSGLHLDEAFDELRERGLEPEDRVLVFAYDTLVTESFLVSLGRITRRSHIVAGASRHPETLLEGPPPKALIVAHRDGIGWPSQEEVIRVYEDFDGFEEDYRPAIEAMDRMKGHGQAIARRRLDGGERLTVWYLGD